MLIYLEVILAIKYKECSWLFRQSNGGYATTLINPLCVWIYQKAKKLRVRYFKPPNMFTVTAYRGYRELVVPQNRADPVKGTMIYRKFSTPLLTVPSFVWSKLLLQNNRHCSYYADYGRSYIIWLQRRFHWRTYTSLRNGRLQWRRCQNMLPVPSDIYRYVLLSAVSLAFIPWNQC